MCYKYEIGIPEIHVDKRYDSTDGRAILYVAKANQKPGSCPRCGRKLHVHSKKTNSIRDIKSEGKLVYIELKIQRYRCTGCRYVFPDEFTFYRKTSHITDRLKQELVNRCVNGETFAYIARDYSVDDKTVSEAFEAYCNEHKELFHDADTPEVLGIDEAHIDKEERLVLTDIKNRKLLDLKEHKDSETVETYLKTLNKDTCRFVTMDFDRVYSKCVERVLPDALIVIDKFHAVKEVIKCFDRTRTGVRDWYCEKDQNNKEKLKQSKNLFMKNWEDLEKKERDSIRRWLTEFPEMYLVIMFKEAFRDIYIRAENREEAEEKFDRWIDAIPKYPVFKKMYKTMKSRKRHILNYWDAPYTNAYAESVNKIIKMVKKSGRGYNFEVLRKLCILRINTEKPGKFDKNKAVFVDSNGNSRTLGRKGRKQDKPSGPSEEKPMETKPEETDDTDDTDTPVWYFENVYLANPDSIKLEAIPRLDRSGSLKLSRHSFKSTDEELFYESEEIPF